MKVALEQLSQKLGSDATYFNAVYAKTFTFGLAANQRHLGTFPILSRFASSQQLRSFGHGFGILVDIASARTGWRRIDT